MTKINRYDFVYFFDVENGNPNGDPDAGNLPRTDPETSIGLVTSGCNKRKIRDYVAEAMLDEPGHRIHIADGEVLNDRNLEAWNATGAKKGKGDKPRKKLPADKDKAAEITQWMCDNFWDVRTFGAVMTNEINAGQVRGPVQMTMSSSVEPVVPTEYGITRCAVTNEKARESGHTMGRKTMIPYGLYRGHGFINARLAGRTGFDEDDLNLFWTAMRDMFEMDRSDSRGLMAMRRLIIFRHESDLGNAQAHRLFERVTVSRQHDGQPVPVGHPDLDNSDPARRFTDYSIDVDNTNLPKGVSIIEPF